MSEENKETIENGEEPKVVKVLKLGIGEENKNTNSLIAMEMQDTKKAGFRKRKYSASRKKSIDGIFGKINLLEVEDNVDKTPLKHLPRRSLLAFDPATVLKGPVESDDEENTTSKE